MPQNKRESLIFTIMMCFFMVLVMSVYNTSVYMGSVSRESVKAAWLGFPIAYVAAMCCDWFLVSPLAKGLAFGFLLKREDSGLKKALVISCCMVVPMVILMSLYGAVEVSLHTGNWNQILLIWARNIGLNVIMALPLQLLIAGPIVRRVFRRAFPVGKIIA